MNRHPKERTCWHSADPGEGGFMFLRAHPIAHPTRPRRRGLFVLLDRGSDAARHASLTALAAVVLHGVSRLRFDHGNLALAFPTGVLGANGCPLVMALAQRADVSDISDQYSFAPLALHCNRTIRANGLGLGECGHGLGRLPVLRTRTGKG